METTDELKKWVESLTIAEKRFITLLGKTRSGATTSQQSELFEWLNRAAPNEEIPKKAKFRHNLPTVSNRLKELILDGLRLLHKDDDTDAVLRTTLDEIARLVSKKLFVPAIRQLKRAKRLAIDRCRYSAALECIVWEQKLRAHSPSGDRQPGLAQLLEEELAMLNKLKELRELTYRHEQLLDIVKQFPYHRDKVTLASVLALAEHELVHRLAATGAYLERALAINLLGIKEMYQRTPTAALRRYQSLLNEWRGHPGWQQDQAELLLLICKFYQNACFYSPVDWEEAQKHIRMINQLNHLPVDATRDFQRLLYHNQLGLALNTGNMEAVTTLIPEIAAWIVAQGKHLTEAQQLSFMCNFLVAEFLMDNFKAAKQWIARIHQLPNQKARMDIRQFALLLQVVVEMELNNDSLNEYLTRAGKRKFSTTTFEVNVELVVLKHLALVNRSESKQEVRKSIDQLIIALAQLENELPGDIPLLGLKEIQIWAEAKQQGSTLRAVFLGEVKKNLAQLENIERVN